MRYYRRQAGVSSGAGTRGNAVPIDIFVWERRSYRNFCTFGNGVPTHRVCILTAIRKTILNAQVQRQLLHVIEEIK